jgi:hypothetical protein
MIGSTTPSRITVGCTAFMRGSRIVVGIAAAAAAVVAASSCTHSAPETSANPTTLGSAASPLPSDQLTAPSLAARPVDATRSPLPADTARERHVDVDTHGAEVDVRSLLDFVASAGDFKIVYAPGINQKVRVTLTDVPASVALQTLLTLANLTIESATPKSGVPGSNSIVFYELPVNVDSLSAESIMKRFGVGRVIADLIVQGRTQKP